MPTSPRALARPERAARSEPPRALRARAATMPIRHVQQTPGSQQQQQEHPQRGYSSDERMATSYAGRPAKMMSPVDQYRQQGPQPPHTQQQPQRHYHAGGRQFTTPGAQQVPQRHSDPRTPQTQPGSHPDSRISSPATVGYSSPSTPECAPQGWPAEYPSPQQSPVFAGEPAGAPQRPFPPPPSRAPPGCHPGQSAAGSREQMVREQLGADAQFVNVDKLLHSISSCGMRDALRICEEEKQAAVLKRPGVVVADRYRCDGTVLGEGSFAYVVRGRDDRTGKGVALKVLRTRFLAEARVERDILSRLSDPRAVQVRGGEPPKYVRMLEYLEDPAGRLPPCIVFPLHGPHLGKIIRGRPLQRPHQRRLAKQLTEAVAAIHSAGVVHTDIRPENIVCDEPDAQSNSPNWTLLDFGNASVHLRGEREADEINTRPYRSSEIVLRTGWTFPCDVWALGCTLYEAAAGDRLFPLRCNDAQHVDEMERILGPMPDLRAAPPARADGAQLRWPKERGGDAVAYDPDLVSLLGCCVAPHPGSRVTAEEASRHPFGTHSSSFAAAPPGRVA